MYFSQCGTASRVARKPCKMEVFRDEREDTVVASERLALGNLPQYLPLVNVERNELILAEKKVKTDMIF